VTDDQTRGRDYEPVADCLARLKLRSVIANDFPIGNTKH
jgi:hypothetical protein